MGGDNSLRNSNSSFYDVWDENDKIMIVYVCPA